MVFASLTFKGLFSYNFSMKATVKNTLHCVDSKRGDKVWCRGGKGRAAIFFIQPN